MRGRPVFHVVHNDYTEDYKSNEIEESPSNRCQSLSHYESGASKTDALTEKGERKLQSERISMGRNLIERDWLQLNWGECGGPKGVKEEGVGYSYTGKFSLRVDATAHRNLYSGNTLQIVYVN